MEQSQQPQQQDDWEGACRILAEFAALDTSQYASLLGSAQERRNLLRPEDEEQEESSSLMCQLDGLLREDGATKATPIPALVQALHRFHANLALLHQQEGTSAQEIRLLQKQLQASRRREGKLEAKCARLHTQNGTLRHKLHEKRAVWKQAKTWLRANEAERESLQEMATVAQLQVHEHVLMTTPGRIRLSSADTSSSNFSDVDALHYQTEDNSERGDLTACASNGSSSSSESQASASTLLTDEGVATLRLGGGKRSLPPHVASSAAVYTLTFPSGIKTGLRVKALPLSEWTPPAKPALQACQLDGSDARSSHEELIPVEEPEEDEGPVFVVCGHHQVDSDDDEPKAHDPRAVLPPVGARIMAVRDQTITSSWSIRQVLDSMGSTADEQPTFTVTFRNGRIRSKQRKTLAGSDSDSDSGCDNNKPIEQVAEQAHPLRNFNIFGMGHVSKGNDASRPIEVTTKPVEEGSDKPATFKSTGNSLMFWRQDEHASQTPVDDLPFQDKCDESQSNETKEHCTDAKIDEAATPLRTRANSLMFWKAGGSSASVVPEDESTDVSMDTIDSTLVLEVTAGMHDGGTTVPTSGTIEPPVDQDKQLDTPKNPLIFWRRSCEKVEDTSEKDTEASSSVTTETSKPALEQHPNDSLAFMLPFWNSPVRAFTAKAPEPCAAEDPMDQVEANVERSDDVAGQPVAGGKTALPNEECETSLAKHSQPNEALVPPAEVEATVIDQLL